MTDRYLIRPSVRKRYLRIWALAAVFALPGCNPAAQDEIEIIQTPLGEMRITPGEVSGVLRIIVSERGEPNLIFLEADGRDEYIPLNVTEDTEVFPPTMRKEDGIVTYHLGKMHRASGSLIEMEDREALAQLLGRAGLPDRIRRPVALEVSELHLLEN